MKKLFYLIIIAVCAPLAAQLGISSNPAYTPGAGIGLGIDGSITVRDKIYVGGTDASLGDPGKEGQVLVSQGAGLPPRWRTLNIPTIQDAGLFYLIYNNAFTDYLNTGTNDVTDTGEGIDITSTGVGSNNGPYTFLTPRSDAIFTNFVSVPGLTKTFDVYSTDSKVYITFEAVAQTDGTSTVNQGVDFSCGIFAGGASTATRTLRGIRRISLQHTTTASVFITYTQIALAEDLAPGSHTVEVACKRNANLSSYAGLFRIGRASATNINNFIAKTSLKVEVYEVPDNLVDIIPN